MPGMLMSFRCCDSYVAKSKRDPNPQMVVMVLMDFDGNEIGKGAECFRRFFGGSVYVAICNEE